MPLRIVNPSAVRSASYTIHVDHLKPTANSQVLVRDRVGNRESSADPQDVLQHDPLLDQWRLRN